MNVCCAQIMHCDHESHGINAKVAMKLKQATCQMTHCPNTTQLVHSQPWCVSRMVVVLMSVMRFIVWDGMKTMQRSMKLEFQARVMVLGCCLSLASGWLHDLVVQLT